METGSKWLSRWRFFISLDLQSARVSPGCCYLIDWLYYLSILGTWVARGESVDSVPDIGSTIAAVSSHSALNEWHFMTPSSFQLHVPYICHSMNNCFSMETFHYAHFSLAFLFTSISRESTRDIVQSCMEVGLNSWYLSNYSDVRIHIYLESSVWYVHESVRTLAIWKICYVSYRVCYSYKTFWDFISVVTKHGYRDYIDEYNNIQEYIDKIKKKKKKEDKKRKKVTIWNQRWKCI